MSRGWAALAAAALLIGVLGLAGCGHRVTPTEDFTDPEALPLPEDLIVSSFITTVALNWFAPPDVFAFIDGWNVYRAEGEGRPADEAYVLINGFLVQETNYLDDEVEDGVRYWYRLTSVSPAGVESPPTEPVTVRVDGTAPPVPTGFTAEARWNGNLGAFEIRVTWDPSPAPDLRHYNLYREPRIPLLPLVTDLFEPLYFDTEVEPDSTYTYRLTAVDGSFNESPPAGPVTVTVPSLDDPR